MGFSGALIIAFAYMFRDFGGIAEACTAVLSGNFSFFGPFSNRFRFTSNSEFLKISKSYRWTDNGSFYIGCLCAVCFSDSGTAWNNFWYSYFHLEICWSVL